MEGAAKRPSRTLAPDGTLCAPAQQPTRVLSPRQARWLLLRDPDDLRAEEHAYRTHLLDSSAEMREAYQLTVDFGQLVRARDQVALMHWLERAAASHLAEFRSFTVGIRRDQLAVEAALHSEWSNGQTEGHINRLKCLKRQMYGRAKIDLLRKRLLRAA